MIRAVSTHVFLRHRLHPGLLDALARSGATGIEIFAFRQHFDYTSRSHVTEIAEWFRSAPLQPFSMHAPIYTDPEMGRDGAPGVNIIHPEKSRRIEAMDEIKRAIEVAEHIPIRYLVLHLGEREDSWSPRTLEHSLTAIEHLRAFANPLGVKLNIENIQNDVTAPANILEILRIGHFTDLGVCFDIGHAHLGAGVSVTLNELKNQIRSTHLHDNDGDKDAHLWPGAGSIEWKDNVTELKAAPKLEGNVLEIHYTPDYTAEAVNTMARGAFERLEI